MNNAFGQDLVLDAIGSSSDSSKIAGEDDEARGGDNKDGDWGDDEVNDVIIEVSVIVEESSRGCGDNCGMLYSVLALLLLLLMTIIMIMIMTGTKLDGIDTDRINSDSSEKYNISMMNLSFRTARHMQSVQTSIRLISMSSLIRVFTDWHSIHILLPLYSNIRMPTAKYFLVV